jgi:hypothetical protein
MMAGVWAAEAARLTSFPVPKYTINLDLDPEDRWNQVADVYGREIMKAYEVFYSLIPQEYRGPIGKATEDAGAEVERKLGQYGLEIQGMAKRIGMPNGDLVLVNLIYEITAKCTSIVAQDESGSIYHGRNLDYGMRSGGGPFTDLLRSIAIEVHFMKNNSLAYMATTFAGYVGVLTGERPGYFTYSIDEVVVGPMYAELLSVLDGLLNPNAHVMGFLIRDLLENSTFTQAVQVMGHYEIVAPAYFILGGMQSGEGVVITRQRNRPVDFWWLDSPTRWYLVETNYDHWLPPPPNDDRLDPANDCMNQMGQAALSLRSLYDCLSVEPVMNNMTTYTAVMHAAEAKYECYVRRCC